MLPVAGDGERGGTTTNCEGRVTRLAAKVVPPGIAWPAWTVASEIARRLGSTLGLDGVDQISAEIARVAPAYRGVDAGLLGRPERRDGVVVPRRAAPVGIAGRRPRPLDPIATPGIVSVEDQGAPLDLGSARRGRSRPPRREPRAGEPGDDAATLTSSPPDRPPSADVAGGGRLPSRRAPDAL